MVSCPPNERLYIRSSVFYGTTVEFCYTQEELIQTDLHHQHLLFKLPHLIRKNLRSCETFYDFKNSNYADINNMLSNVYWKETFFCNSICVNADSLYITLNNIISCTVPIKRRFMGKFPIWYTNDLKSLILEKKRAHLCWKISNNPDDYIQFKRLRAQCIKLSNSCYR